MAVDVRRKIPEFGCGRYLKVDSDAVHRYLLLVRDAANPTLAWLPPTARP